ncbi:MAG: TrmB family transcriptional regulator [Methanophagales archaeon]|nr:TrmB family transcriptional regulator [Methanophagales archaeon]
MEVKKLLKELGLSNYEIEAYLKVVELGIAEAGVICKQTRIPFGRVYQELNSLAAKGLIEVQNTRPKRYMARKSRLAFKTLLQQKRENMEKQLQKMIEAASQIEDNISNKILTGPKERTFWRTAVGVEETAEMIRLNFEEAEKEICCVILDYNSQNGECECEFEDSESNMILNEVIKATERGVKIKALLNKEFIIPELEYLEELGIKEKIIGKVEIRVMKNAIPSYFEVIDCEKVVLEVANPKNPGQILAMTKIWDVKLAKELREKFEDLWSEAKPLKTT